MLKENNLANRIQRVLKNWNSITDHRGAICAALYVSNRKLNQSEIKMGKKLQLGI